MYQAAVQTVRGIRYFYWGLIVFFFVGFLGFATAAYTLSIGDVLGRLGENTGDLPDSDVMGKVVGLLPLVCGFVTVIILGLVFALLGFSGMYRGRMEYGHAHQKNVERALYFFIVVIVLFIVNTGASIGASAPALGGTIGDLGNASLGMTALYMATQVAMALAIALFVRYPVMTFISSKQTNLLLLAIALYAAAPIADRTASLVYSPPEGYYDYPQTVAWDPIWLVPLVLSLVLTAVAVMIFIMVYRLVLARLRSREVKPVWEPAAQMQAAQPPQEVRWQPPPSP